MKLFFALVGILGAGVLGYFAEPSLRHQLTGASRDGVSSPAVLGLPDGSTKINLGLLSADQLPAQVLLSADVKLTDSTSGVTTLLQAGNQARLIRIDGDNAIVSLGTASARGVVSILDTDLIEQLVAKLPFPPATSSDVVAVMQASIQAQQVTEFTFDQVLEWIAGADEVVDGKTYQTGIASYKAETIFGIKTMQAKALIREGKVERWIWPKSGMHIQ